MATFGQPRVYPNLNPSAAVPVDREQIFSLSSFAENYRMRRGKEHGQYVPNAKFTFVKLMTGETLMHQRFRHPTLAEGKPVLYAGEAHFNNGKLDWWSNGSGNYRPDADHAAQAGLPTDQFFTYDQILKGIHAQAKTPETASRKQPIQAKLMPGGHFPTPNVSVPAQMIVQQRLLPSMGAPPVYRPMATAPIQAKMAAPTVNCPIPLVRAQEHENLDRGDYKFHRAETRKWTNIMTSGNLSHMGNR